MPQFTYEAMDFKGRRAVHTDDAASREDILLRLQHRGLVLLRWLDKEAPGSGGLSAMFSRRSERRMKKSELLELTRELGHLMRSGLPMERALNIIANSSSMAGVKTTADYLRDSLRGGNSLSDALSRRPGDFNDLYVNMVRAGEAGGILPDILKKLSEFMERTQEIKRFIVSSSIYPAILMLVGLLSVVIIMSVVVPRFANIFHDLGQEIPTSTQLLIYISDFFQKWWGFILAGLIVSGFGLWRFSQTTAGKKALDHISVKLPLLGNLLIDIEVSRLARTLGTLIQSGVPILKALLIVREVAGNSLVKSAVDFIHQNVKEGKRVSSLMQKKAIFPAMSVQMVALGEETGKIGEMLELVANDLDQKIQVRIRTGLAMLEPVTILMMGLMIGGIVISMLSAIFGINEIDF